MLTVRELETRDAVLSERTRREETRGFTRQRQEIEFRESPMNREGELSEIFVFHRAKGRNEEVHFGFRRVFLVSPRSSKWITLTLSDRVSSSLCIELSSVRRD